MTRTHRLALSVVLIASLLLGLSASIYAKEITLRFWAIGDRMQAELLEKIFSDFTKEHPNIKVQLTMNAEWEDHYQKTLIAVAGGTPPDIIRSKDFWVPEFASRGAIEDLDKWVAADPSMEIVPEEFWPVRWEQSSYQGKLYSLPWTTFTQLFFYNEELFENAGIGGPPDTWEELRLYALKTTDVDNKQWGTCLYTYDRVGPPMTEFWEILLMQAGGSMMNADATEFTFASEAGVEALTHQLDMIYKDGSMMPPEFASLTQPIERGKIAMWYSGPWLFNSLPAQFPDLRWKAALMPENKSRATYATGNNLVMMSGSKNKEAAWELLKFMFRAEYDFEWNALGGYLPSRRSNLDIAPFTTDPNWMVAKAQFMRDDTVPRPYPLGFNEIHNKIAAWLQKAYLNRVSPAEALRAAQDEANQLLKTLNQ
ncbi:MAG: ABC transporter substrate-binding protein [Firmicutes bacterium]|jgi:multiple sugar transport system substrate-binding protein|nr:ABC transporter substrate-binding protein [Bacillota bacterium]